MTDREINVLVIRTPRVIENIEACMAHVRQGLREGVLILGADIKYSVEQFPPLGYAAVEDACGTVVFDLRRKVGVMWRKYREPSTVDWSR